MLNKFLLAMLRQLGAIGSALMISVTAISSSLLVYTMLASLEGVFSWRGLCNAFIIPGLIAPPLSYIYFRLFKRLDETENRLRNANRELLRLASVDGLTLVANRRRMDEYLEKEWRRARREGWPLSVVICDLDQFKPFNDLHGHPAGDRLLQAVAGLISGLCRRPADLCARFGGDEFVVLLPNTDLAGAAELAETIRKKAQDLTVPRVPEGRHRVTLSCGVAVSSLTDDDNPHAVLDRADQALYRAKHQGRNRVEVDRLEPAEPPDGYRGAAPGAPSGGSLPH